MRDRNAWARRVPGSNEGGEAPPTATASANPNRRLTATRSLDDRGGAGRRQECPYSRCLPCRRPLAFITSGCACGSRAPLELGDHVTRPLSQRQPVGLLVGPGAISQPKSWWRRQKAPSGAVPLNRIPHHLRFRLDRGAPPAWPQPQQDSRPGPGNFGQQFANRP